MFSLSQISLKIYLGKFFVCLFVCLFVGLFVCLFVLFFVFGLLLLLFVLFLFCFCQMLAKIKMTRNKNRLFGCNLKMVSFLKIFLQNCVFFYSAYGAKFQLESGFLGEVTEVKVPWSLKCFNTLKVLLHIQFH